jgi:uncharacterized protein YfaS (alpha-2-macroglobulin family)
MTAETNEIIAAKWITVKTAGKVEWTVIPTEFAPNVYISALFSKIRG